MEEWAKILLTAFGACVVSWGGVAVKHWFDGRSRKETWDKRLKEISDRVSALETLKTKDHQAEKMAAKWAEARVGALTPARYKLEALATATREASIAWAPPDQGQLLYDNTAPRLRQSAANIVQEYAQIFGHDELFLDHLRRVTDATHEIGWDDSIDIDGDEFARLNVGKLQAAIDAARQDAVRLQRAYQAELGLSNPTA